MSNERTAIRASDPEELGARAIEHIMGDAGLRVAAIRNLEGTAPLAEHREGGSRLEWTTDCGHRVQVHVYETAREAQLQIGYPDGSVAARVDIPADQLAGLAQAFAHLAARAREGVTA